MIKRLNRFLRWAEDAGEGWVLLIIMVLGLWTWVQGERIDDLQAVLFAQVASTQGFTTRHLDFHGELSSFHDRIVDLMADIILEDVE